MKTFWRRRGAKAETLQHAAGKRAPSSPLQPGGRRLRWLPLAKHISGSQGAVGSPAALRYTVVRASGLHKEDCVWCCWIGYASEFLTFSRVGFFLFFFLL